MRHRYTLPSTLIFIGIIFQIVGPYCIRFYYSHIARGFQCWAPILEHPTCSFKMVLTNRYNWTCNYRNASALCNLAARNGCKRCRELVVKAYFLSLKGLSDFRDPSLFPLQFSSSMTVKQNKAPSLEHIFYNGQKQAI